MDNKDSMVLKKRDQPKVSQYNNSQSGFIGKRVVDADTGEVYNKTSKTLDKPKIDALIKMRSANNLDQKTLATKLNVSLNEIKNAELGKEIKLKTFNAICNELNKNI
jgi:hypothetical protein